MVKPTKRQKQAELRREQLVEAALGLFSTKGYEKTTIKDLADAAGVTSGLLYYYFPDKEALLHGVVRQHSFLSELQGMLAAPEDRSASEMLRLIAARFSALLERRAALVRVLVREAQTNPTLSAYGKAVVREEIVSLSAYLDTRIAAGELRPHETEVTAKTLLYTVFMQSLLGEASESMFDPFVEGLLRGILAPV